MSKSGILNKNFKNHRNLVYIYLYVKKIIFGGFMSTFVFWSGVYVQVGKKSSGGFRSAGFSSYIDFNADN